MARPLKSGLDYFPLDVNIFDDAFRLTLISLTTRRWRPYRANFRLKAKLLLSNCSVRYTATDISMSGPK